jgi:plasmid stabilization system protein ParE
MAKQFSLRYLPLFERDLATAWDYIAEKLHNPQAADRLVEETEQAIQKRLAAPLSFQVYPSQRKREHPYYRIGVKHYSVFYVVIDGVMEVRRFLYSRRNMRDVL